MKSIAILLPLFITGCAAMLPSIETQHPAGRAKLIVMVPACKTPTLKNYGACLNAADMLESARAAQAISKFIAHWDQSVFGDMQDMKRGGTMSMSPERTYVGGSVQADAARAITAVSVPVLQTILDSDTSDYGMKMKPQLNLIVPMSKETLNTFREAHSRAL